MGEVIRTEQQTRFYDRNRGIADVGLTVKETFLSECGR
jgi:hypothetical protein